MAELDSLEIKIEASASQASDNLDKVMAKLEKISNSLNGINTSKLANLGKSIDRISSGTTGASKSVGTVSSRLQSMNSVMSKSAKHSKSLASAFGSFYANCFLLIRGAKAVGKAIEGSMDYVETFNYWNVTLGKIGKEFGGEFEKYGYDSAESYADSFSGRLKDLTSKMTGYSVGDKGELIQTDVKNLGVDPQKLMGYQANISAVTNSLGLCGETSVNTSKALSMLAVDMSSFKNVDLSTVMTNFQSGLIGQSRALYKYGIDITNATLQTYAYDNGIKQAVSTMTQADKMQLRLLAILDQSKVAWGDQANTISSVANQYRILKQQISNLARIIGNLFLPIVQKVLPVINGLVMALQRLFTILGFKAFGGDWLKDLQDGISSGSGGSGLEELGDSAGESADALDKANDAAKKLNTTTRGIDELNIISPQDESGSGANSPASGGGIDLSDSIADAVGDYELVWDEALKKSENMAKEICDKIIKAFQLGDYKGIGTYVSTGITDALNSIDWNSIYAVGKAFGTNFAQFLNGLITPGLFGAVGKTIAGALNTAVYTALSFATTFDWSNLGLSIASGVNTFFSTFDFAALAQSVNKWVKGLFNTLTTTIGNIDWLTVYDGIIAFLENLDIGTVGIIIGALTIKKILGLHLASKALSMIGAEISKSLAGVIGSKLGLDLAEGAGLGSAFAGIGKQMGGNILTGLKAAFGDKAAFKILKDMTGGAAIIKNITGIGTVIGGAVTAVTNFFSMWKDGFSWLKEILMVIGTAIAAVGAVILGAPAVVAGAIAAIVAAVGTAAVVIHDNWDAICQFFSGLPEWFSTNVITPVCNFFQGLWSKVSGFFSGLWEDISAIWGTVSEWFSSHVIEPLCDFFKEAWSRVNSFFIGLWEDISGIWVSASTWFNEKVITPIVGFFQGLWTRVQQVFEGLWIIIQAVWIVASTWFNDNVVQPAIGFFKNLCDTVSGFFKNLWDSVSGFLTQLKSDIESIWDTVSTWFNDNVVVPIVGFFKDLWDTISGFFINLWNGIVEIWTLAPTWFNDTVIIPIVEFFTLFWETVTGIFTELWNGICELWGAASEWFDLNVIIPVATFFLDLKTKVLGFFTELWQSIQKIWGAAAKWFSDTIITPLVSAFDSFKETVGEIFDKIWSSIKSGVVSAMNAVIGAIETSINWIVGAINKIISGFNKVVSWAAKIAEVDWGGVDLVSEVHIERIATFENGGFPNTGELFMARENGIAEMVGAIGNRPAVANNDEITQAITDAVAQGMNTEEQNRLLREQNSLLQALVDKDTDITLNGRSLKEEMDRTTKRLGWNFQPV